MASSKTIATFPFRWPRTLGTTCVALLAFVGIDCASAATFCVHTSAQLQAALTTAETNGENDIIKVAEGSYTAPAGGFDYQAYAQSGSDDYDLEISGGWYDAFGFACLGHHANPFQTLLDGGGTSRVMNLAMRNHSNVTVRFLTFSNGNAGNDYGGGLSLFAGDTGYTAIWTVERNAFVANTAEFGAGMNATINQAASTAKIKVINNLFTLNHASGDSGAANLANDGGDSIYLTNNTIVSNTTDSTGAYQIGGIYMYGSGSFKFVANNNFWNNDADDLYVTADQAGYSLLHNNYQLRGGTAPTQVAGNLDVTPQYQHGFLNYTPVRSSPLVDAGINPAPFAYWYLSSDDINGVDRTVGQVDIGAYEEDIIFADGFENAPAF